MTTDKKSIDMGQLLAEAEELISEINAGVIKEMEEEHRLQFELYAQKLKEIKANIQATGDEKETPGTSSLGEGMHEGILDIIKSMQELTTYLS
ncbi:hypothetical protein [Desulfocicer niacini]